MNNKRNFSCPHQHLKDKKRSLQFMEQLHNTANGMLSYFLMWNQDYHLIAYDENIFELYPDSHDIFVIGRTFEETLRIGFAKGDFEPLKKMIAEQWIDHRLELHKQGDYFNVRQIKGRWIQIRDQKTEDGYIITTAIDVTHLKKQEKELKEQAKGLKAAKERADKAESLLRDAIVPYQKGLAYGTRKIVLFMLIKSYLSFIPTLKTSIHLGVLIKKFFEKALKKVILLYQIV